MKRLKEHYARHRNFYENAGEALGCACFGLAMWGFCWLCCACSGYHWE